MPIPKSELIELWRDTHVKNDHGLKSAKNSSVGKIDLNKALMIKQFLAIKTEHKPIKKKQPDVIIILDD